MIYCNKETDYTRYSRMISPLSIGNTPVQFATTAEHVGVLRSVSGNLPHLQQRIVSHRSSLAQILSMGMSKKHRASPIAALRAENIFTTPILYSGVASLLVTKSETAPEPRIECDNVKDIFTNVINHVLDITEAVVWFNPLIVADLDTTGVVAGFGITITNHTAQVTQSEENLK